MKNATRFMFIGLAFVLSGCTNADQQTTDSNQSDTSQSQEISEPSINQQQSLIDGWTMYRNETYGFEVQYPKQTIYEINYYAGDKQKNKITTITSNTYATVPEKADSVAIGWGPNSFFEIDFLSNQENLSLLEFIENDIATDNKNNKLSIDTIKNSGEHTTLNGKEVYKFTADQCCLDSYKLIQGQQEFIYFKYDNNTIGRIAYHITNPQDNHDSEHKNLFQKMLTTFRFVE